MSDATATRRLFFALWPDAEVRQRLAQTAQHWTRQPVPEANLHMTLAFLGACSAQQQDCLGNAAGTVLGAPFELQLNYLGNWSRTQWLGTSHIPAALLQLVDHLRQALEPCAVKIEKRHFVPHVTLSRKEKNPQTQAGLEAIPWRVDSFVLAESLSTPDGVRYAVLRRWPLAPAPD